LGRRGGDGKPLVFKKELFLYNRNPLFYPPRVFVNHLGYISPGIYYPDIFFPRL